MNVCMFVIAECEVGVCVLTLSINAQALESTKSSQLMNIIYENLNFKCPEFYQCLQSTYYNYDIICTRSKRNKRVCGACV